MALITDEQLIQGLAEQMGMQTVTLEDATFDEDVLAKISETMAQLYRVVPLKFRAQRLDRGDLRPPELEHPRRIADVPGGGYRDGRGDRTRRDVDHHTVLRQRNRKC